MTVRGSCIDGFEGAGTSTLVAVPLGKRAIPVTLLPAVSVAILLVALFTRVMCEPLRHDEQIYVATAWMFGREGLYSHLSYPHLPNYPMMLHAFLWLTGSEDPFAMGRVLTFLCWMGFLLAFGATAWRLSNSFKVTTLALVLIVTNVLFVDYTAMLAAAHLFPILFITLGLFFFLAALQGDAVRIWYVLISGLCISLAIGFRVNYIVMAAPFAVFTLLVPHLPFRRRVLAAFLPLAAGGILGALPTLYYLATVPNIFIFDVFSYFFGPHRQFLSDPVNGPVPMGLSLASRLFYGYRIWIMGPTLLLVVPLVYCLARSDAARLRIMTAWPGLLCAGLVFVGIAVSFVPAPSFPQYFMPPIPFAILLIAYLLGAQAEERPIQNQAIMIATGLAAIVSGGPMLFQHIHRIVSPGSWETSRVQRTAERIRTYAGGDGRAPLIATLAPIYALNAGSDIYPELASGPFYYRIGDYLSASERASYRISSPGVIGSLFNRHPPDAVLIGGEGILDKPLERFALDNGYQRVLQPVGRDRYGEIILYTKGQPNRPLR